MKRDTFNEKVGPYAKNDAKLQRQRKVASSNTPKKDLERAAERMSVLGLSRPVTVGSKPRRYGP